MFFGLAELGVCVWCVCMRACARACLQYVDKIVTVRVCRGICAWLE